MNLFLLNISLAAFANNFLYPTCDSCAIFPFDLLDGDSLNRNFVSDDPTGLILFFCPIAKGALLDSLLPLVDLINSFRRGVVNSGSLGRLHDREAIFVNQSDQLFSCVVGYLSVCFSHCS